jgi:hypothetical protein
MRDEIKTQRQTESANHRLLRLSLVAVWLITALVSWLEWQGDSARLLLTAGLTDARWMNVIIIGGALLDLVIGYALWLRPHRATYVLALVSMAVMTVLATILLPHLWLHPLGMLSKNIPIAVILWVLIKGEKVEVA